MLPLIASAALALALTLTPASAHDDDALTTITRPDGTRLTVQAEYADWTVAHMDDPRLVIYEDGSPSLVSLDGCYAENPAGQRFALRDC